MSPQVLQDNPEIKNPKISSANVAEQFKDLVIPNSDIQTKNNSHSSNSEKNPQRGKEEIDPKKTFNNPTHAAKQLKYELLNVLHDLKLTHSSITKPPFGDCPTNLSYEYFSDTPEFGTDANMWIQKKITQGFRLGAEHKNFNSFTEVYKNNNRKKLFEDLTTLVQLSLPKKQDQNSKLSFVAIINKKDGVLTLDANDSFVIVEKKSCAKPAPKHQNTPTYKIEDKTNLRDNYFITNFNPDTSVGIKFGVAAIINNNGTTVGIPVFVKKDQSLVETYVNTRYSPNSKLSLGGDLKFYFGNMFENKPVCVPSKLTIGFLNSSRTAHKLDRFVITCEFDW